MTHITVDTTDNRCSFASSVIPYNLTSNNGLHILLQLISVKAFRTLLLPIIRHTHTQTTVVPFHLLPFILRVCLRFT